MLLLQKLVCTKVKSRPNRRNSLISEKFRNETKADFYSLHG